MKYLVPLLLLVAEISFAQNIQNGFNFFLPPYDSTTQNFLPEFEKRIINNDEFVTINPDGHFSVKGKRIRFWSNNMTDASCFPEKNNAGLMVGRLRKLGFNLMRFHYFDAGWGTDPYIFTPGASTRQLNSVNHDKMEYLINEFKNNGIYIDMNLHVARTFKVLDGIPDADSLKDFGKAITLFDPYLIQLQKEYAAQILTHVNPYTGLALVNDPVMSMLEITNENWFFLYWQSDQLKPITMGGILTHRHNNMLEDLWNDYLLEKYGTTDVLNEAWSGGSKEIVELLQNGSFENSGLSPFQFGYDNSAAASAVIDNSTSAEGNNSVKIDITVSAGINWQITLVQTNLSLQKDSTYKIEFYAKSDLPQNTNVTVQLQHDPYTIYFASDIYLTTEWKKYTYYFTGSENISNEVQFSFYMGLNSGSIWFDDVSFKKHNIGGMISGESIESKNIHRMYKYEVTQYTSQRQEDLYRFFVKLQDDYYQEMYSYLKNDLGVRVPISGTNWFTGVPDIMIQNKLDYLDVHAYWDHPTNGKSNNTPMVKNPASSTILNCMAGQAMEGKPFTISEYNHPIPNIYQVEMPFFLGGYGSFHDVDAVMMFGISEAGSGTWTQDKIYSNFNTGRNNVLMSLMPTFGYVYRNGLIKSSDITVALNYSQDDVYDLFTNNSGFWMYSPHYPSQLALTSKMRTSGFNSNTNLNYASLPPVQSSPYITNTNEVTWDENGLLKIETEKFIGFVGFLNNFIGAEIGNTKIVDANNFAGITLLSIDDNKLVDSKKILLTLATRQENSGTVWASDFKSLISAGNSPTIIEPAIVTLSLNLNADSLRLNILDTKGGETGNNRVYYPDANNNFAITLDQNLDKTLWFGIETEWEAVLNKSITLVSPAGGEIFNPGTETEIKWTYRDIEKINILFSSDEGQYWSVLASGIDASATNYKWVIPQTTSDKCLIKLVDSDDETVYAQSAAVFTIEINLNKIINGTFSEGMKGWIAFANANAQAVSSVDSGVFHMDIINGGTETWHIQLVQSNIKIEKGKKYFVKLNAWSSGTRNAKVSLTRDGGDYATYGGSDISLTVNPKEYTFQFTMNSNTDDNARFVVDIGKSNYDLYADNIVLEEYTAVPELKLSAPNGGEKWKAGSIQEISWVSKNIDNIKIEYSSNGGLQWQVIQVSISAAPGKYNWTVPKVSSSECVVRVSSTNDNNISSQSSSNFRILNPTISITSPPEKAEWVEKSIREITWQSQDVESVDIFVSYNNNSNWIIIADSLQASAGKYSWTVPSITSDECYIKIISVEDGQVYSQSPVFSITKLVSVKDVEIPTEYALDQNFPNPFNPATIINYSIPKSTHVKIVVFNILGETIQVLVNRIESPGNYSITFNAALLRSGVYFYRITAGDFIKTKKMIFSK